MRPPAPFSELSNNSMKREEFKEVRARMSRLSVPNLIEELGSDSLATRFIAEMCLRDIANT